MKILTRYVIGAHLGPFLFSFVAVTGLLFLNAVAQRLEQLAGRGLDWGTLREFMVLSLPHVIALTFPMSVLVAALYACSEMTSNNEIAAMAGGGVHPGRIMVPLVGAGVLFSFFMFYFNDRVLPESNHRLSTLLQAVATKSPTLELQESVINRIPTDDEFRYYIRASSIDTRTNYLEDIDIYDLSRPDETRTIVAKEGEMAYSLDGKDLFFTLRKGSVYVLSDAMPGDFQHMTFDTQILPMRGVVAEMDRETGTDFRSEREMTGAMLRSEVEIYQARVDTLVAQSYETSLATVQKALGSAFPEWRAVDEADLVAPEAAAGGTTPSPPDSAASGIAAAPAILPPLDAAPPGASAGTRGTAAFTQDGVLQLSQRSYLPARDDLVEFAASQHRVNRSQWQVNREQVASNLVEFYKKYAIAFACLVFALLAPPLALRYPRGGVGMVIAASLGIFFLYWMGLMGGERLADKLRMDPMIAMWAPNLIFLMPALLLLSRMGRAMSSNRGGTWDELTYRVGEIFGKLTGSKRRATARGTPSEEEG